MSVWNRAAKLAASVGLVGAGLVLGLVVASSQPAVGSVPQETARAAMADRSDALPGMVPQGVFVDVADSVGQAVVFIEAERPAQRNPNSNGQFQQFFDDFFGGRDQPEAPDERGAPDQFEDTQRSQGSGVIVTADGYVVTNAHVVASYNRNTQELETASQVRVIMADDRLFDAEIIGVDIGTDIALLKLDGRRLPHAPLGDSDAVRVGEWVMAIGAPFGLQNTVSAGIVSALGRANLSGMETVYQSFVQTDAAINPGNSGGPLVNLHGEVIGINTAIATSGAFNPSFNGVGFAVPANMARRVMDSLIEHGRVIRGYLGVTVRDLTRDLREAYDLDPRLRGAIINTVNEGGPAAAAGLRSEDVVVGMNGERLGSQQDFLQRIAEQAPGDEVRLHLVRGTEELDLSVTLTERPDETEILASQLNLRNPGRSREEPEDEPEDQSSDAARALGLQVAELTPRFARELDLPAGTSGVVVGRIVQNGPAWRAGLQQGDVIMRLNRQEIATVAEFNAIMSQVRPGGVVAAYIWSRATRAELPIALRVPAQ